MSFCSKCGKETGQGSKFCGNCGAPLKPVNIGLHTKRSTKIKMIVPTIAIISVCIIYMVSGIFSTEPVDSKHLKSGVSKAEGDSVGQNNEEPEAAVSSSDKVINEQTAAKAVGAFLQSDNLKTLSTTEYYEVRGDEAYRYNEMIYVPIYAPTGDRGLQFIYVAVANPASAFGDTTIFYEGEELQSGERLEEFQAYDYL
ncbi:zinc ribbon domain-containing protein [[Clostridium] hylemonae]|uniref:Zinc-ribbon domain-containing protein n=1 Tax=[Clostridium] hylemonae DSM 15053 TaxID=553973 RepID=C0C6E6_9FIRM|nr:zinc-ribbon domain-containing protein [[Clostridium] hylemonae]EEG72281.1 hypothetical protein CLOHYLEM_07683 [[Clostridium] hylemonae DSM 15053]QEK16836.1 hypothetical protein LAJLEIBI_00838 [[Clostridium] hylemonae DSM 15053]